MAAYAALVSLMNTTHNIQKHPRLSPSLNNYQIENLRRKLDFLLDYVERYRSNGVISKKLAPNLESQIASAARAAEVAIEAYIVDRIHAGSKQKSLKRKKDQSLDDEGRLVLNLQKIAEEEIDPIVERVIKVKEETGFNAQQPPNSTSVASSRSRTTSTMVGFDGYLNQLLDWLTGQQSERLIIPITGMGGIGKTTLARNVYEDSLIAHHFDKRAWVTVSQEYCLKQILLETLSSLGDNTSGLDELSEDEQGGTIHRILFGRRYLIILDDMWSIEAWEKMKYFFPQNNNRSRIVVTTRQSDMANFFGSSALALSLLDDDNSWHLFCEKAFCPSELEVIGRNIVRKCRGLPLSIVVIGGLLGKSPRTRDHWENVEKDLMSVLNSAEDNQCLKILSLSYSYLPARLKPCFLYLGIFPETNEIYVSRLIKLWVAEGFLKPNINQSLEEVAEGYMNDLVDRNLILVYKSVRSDWEHRICKVHDLLRELCIKAAEEENFFAVMRGLNTSRDIDLEGRSEFHKIILWERLSSCSQLLSLFVRGETHCQKSEFWRVVISPNACIDSLDNICAQVSLRLFEGPGFTRQAHIYKLPSSISQLWNLQTLTIPGYKNVVAPSEIWEMPQLRHVQVAKIGLPDPPPSGKHDHIVLENLQTLEIVLNFRCTEEVFKRMPNIKKLEIEYGAFSSEEAINRTMAYHRLYSVDCFSKLEILSYRFVDDEPTRDDLVRNVKFPSSLKKLTLESCKLHWNDLIMIGSLPHLEVLNLKYSAVVGPEWNPIEGEFLRLKFLGIYNCNLIHWNADSCHFPVLEELHLTILEELDEIPLGIGEIPTLRVISLDNCSASSAISAVKILEEQETVGNDGLHVLAQFRDEDIREEVRERVELEGFPTHNFQLYRGGIPTSDHFGTSIGDNPEFF